MKIREFIIIPSSIDAMGLIHKPGVGPNNRFGFKNTGNNRANENKIKLSTDPNYFGAAWMKIFIENTEYLDPYKAGLKLSAIPPSTLTYFLRFGISFIPPIV